MIESYGPHRVRHGNVMDPDAMAELMGDDKAVIMYTDPPWGDGAMKLWTTLNARDNGEQIEPAAFADFCRRIFGIARDYVTGYLLVEMGLRWRQEMQAQGTACGFAARGIISTVYRSGAKMLPLDLHVFTRGLQPFPENYQAAVQGTHGYQTVKNAVGLIARPGIILDPTCGMGYTAQAAVDFGMAFRGNELNRKRLNKTVARLTR